MSHTTAGHRRHRPADSPAADAASEREDSRDPRFGAAKSPADAGRARGAGPSSPAGRHSGSSLTPRHAPPGGMAGHPGEVRPHSRGDRDLEAAARAERAARLRTEQASQRKRDLQLAGVAVLMSLATSVTVGGPLPVDQDTSEFTFRLDRDAPAPEAGSPAAPAGLLARLHADHLIRNSLYLILSTAVQAGLGFAFWLIAARLFSTADVGRAGSLLSATALVAFLALLGLNSTFIRFLPVQANRDALITAGVLLAALCGGTIGLGYVLLTPIIAPKLDFVAHSPALAVGFVVLAAAGSVNLLTDSVFIADRKAGFNAFIDGGVGGVTKLISCFALAGTGAYGLFCASAGGLAVAALASLLLMARALRWRPTLKSSRAALVPLLRFSGANYAGNILNMLPTLIVPLIVLDRIGAAAAAYYFVAFQAATLIYSGASAVEQSFLAEGAHDGVVGRDLRRRSLRLVMGLCIPAWLLFTVAAHWMMLAFGTRYLPGTSALMVLAAAAVPLAAMNWLLTLLRLTGQLRAVVMTNAVYVAAIGGAAWLLAPHGLAAVCAAWPVGALLAAATAGVAAAAKAPRPSHARRRRAPQARRV
jgi:O-antigen/teichoic acid export membrane protein